MRRAPLLLGLGLTMLSSCQTKGAPMNLHYVVRTPQGGAVQELTVKGRQAGFYAFSRSKNKVLGGTFTLSEHEAAALPRLSAGLKNYTCKPVAAADNQVIEIAVQGVQIHCTEADMDENRGVGQLIQAIRKLTASHLAH